LTREGHRFRSATDTEVIAHLIERYRSSGWPEALVRAARHLEGAYAFACIAADAPETIVAVRSGSSPLLIGVGHGETLLASDIPALLGETREILTLQEGELAVLTSGDVSLRTLDGRSVTRAVTTVPWDVEAAQKAGHPHYMLKEILEQPEAVRNTLRERMDPETGEILIPELGLKNGDLAGLNRLSFVGCGTSWHAALVGKYLVKALARLPVEVEIASEFRQDCHVLDGRTLTVPISQSGETADTLAALRVAKEHGSRTVGICNVVGSSLAREVDGVIYTRAGIEIGVASTKAFTTQLAAIILLALKLGQARGLADRALSADLARALWESPVLMTDLLALSDQTRKLAERFVESRGALYLGRGIHYPLALEGALKLKEVSYIHAEGYPAGEMKHGPIALVNDEMPVIAIAPHGPTYEKMVSNIEEVKAREATVLALATAGDDDLASRVDFVLPIPAALHWIQPLLVALPLQLLAYHLGVLRGCDVDQPRNLAKSVTVE